MSFSTSEEQLEYWIQRARAGKLPLIVANVIIDWKNDREKLKADLDSLYKHHVSTVGFEVDKTTWFYKNCKIQRRKGAKICSECPFRSFIEAGE